MSIFSLFGFSAQAPAASYAAPAEAPVPSGPVRMCLEGFEAQDENVQVVKDRDWTVFLPSIAGFEGLDRELKGKPNLSSRADIEKLERTVNKVLSLFELLNKELKDKCKEYTLQKAPIIRLEIDSRGFLTAEGKLQLADVQASFKEFLDSREVLFEGLQKWEESTFNEMEEYIRKYTKDNPGNIADELNDFFDRMCEERLKVDTVSGKESCKIIRCSEELGPISQE